MSTSFNNGAVTTGFYEMAAGGNVNSLGGGVAANNGGVEQVFFQQQLPTGTNNNTTLNTSTSTAPAGTTACQQVAGQHPLSTTNDNTTGAGQEQGQNCSSQTSCNQQVINLVGGTNNHDSEQPNVNQMQPDLQPGVLDSSKASSEQTVVTSAQLQSLSQHGAGASGANNCPEHGLVVNTCGSSTATADQQAGAGGHQQTTGTTSTNMEHQLQGANQQQSFAQPVSGNDPQQDNMDQMHSGEQMQINANSNTQQEQNPMAPGAAGDNYLNQNLQNAAEHMTNTQSMQQGQHQQQNNNLAGQQPELPPVMLPSTMNQSVVNTVQQNQNYNHAVDQANANHAAFQMHNMGTTTSMGSTGTQQHTMQMGQNVNFQYGGNNGMMMDHQQINAMTLQNHYNGAQNPINMLGPAQMMQQHQGHIMHNPMAGAAAPASLPLVAAATPQQHPHQNFLGSMASAAIPAMQLPALPSTLPAPTTSAVQQQLFANSGVANAGSFVDPNNFCQMAAASNLNLMSNFNNIMNSFLYPGLQPGATLGFVPGAGAAATAAQDLLAFPGAAGAMANGAAAMWAGTPTGAGIMPTAMNSADFMTAGVGTGAAGAGMLQQFSGSGHQPDLLP